MEMMGLLFYKTKFYQIRHPLILLSLVQFIYPIHVSQIGASNFLKITQNCGGTYPPTCFSLLKLLAKRCKSQ